MSQLLARFKALGRDLRLLWVAIFCLNFGFGIYSAVFYNFATESLRIRPEQLGYVEAVRELPGFLCVGVAAIAAQIAEPLLGSIALFLMGVGMAAYAIVHGIPTLLVFSFVWSIGFHSWMPLQSSLVLNLARKNIKGKRLGQTLGVSSIGAVAGMLVVRIVGHGLAYPQWFVFGSISIILAALTMLPIRRDICHPAKPNLVLKPRYKLYYGLTFLEGCRKQVFMTFAIYALTKVYHTHLRTVALLMIINNIVNIFGGPIVGKMIDKIGEKRILMTSYSALILVFLGYATIHREHALFALYCLDNFFYLSTTCLTTYLQKIADPADLTPTLSMGVTFNHAAAVLVPLIGGFLWAKLGYSVTFFGGAAVVAVSLLLASRVRPAKADAAVSG
ncbi:MAG: MFS transporter [Armatimonadota bacterium]|nr:MFS transporter [bacterium]